MSKTTTINMLVQHLTQQYVCPTHPFTTEKAPSRTSCFSSDSSALGPGSGTEAAPNAASLPQHLFSPITFSSAQMHSKFSAPSHSTQRDPFRKEIMTVCIYGQIMVLSSSQKRIPCQLWSLMSFCHLWQTNEYGYGETKAKCLVSGMRLPSLIYHAILMQIYQVYHTNKLQNQGYMEEQLEKFHDVILELNRRAPSLGKVCHSPWSATS